MAKLEYGIIRSGRKTLSLEVTREGGALVRAPYRMGAEEIEAFVSSHEGWFYKHREKMLKRAAANQEPDEEEISALVDRAKDYIPGRVLYYTQMMGVAPAGITITGARRSHGSCSSKNRLCFSFYLMRYPDEAVDYVVAHELAHIRHKNHGKDFYGFIERFMPDYRERAKLLKKEELRLK